MASSSLYRSLLSATIATGSVFAAAVSPLALYRSQMIEVTIQNQPVLSTDLKSLSGPYIGVSGFISAAIGFSILGVSGWRSAVQKARTLEKQVSSLQHDLLTHRSELERFKFSQQQLQAHHLNAFVDPDSEKSLQLDSTRAHSDVAPVIPVIAKSKEHGKVNQNSQNSLPPVEKAKASDEQLEQLLKQVQMLSAQLEQLKSTQSGQLVAYITEPHINQVLRSSILPTNMMSSTPVAATLANDSPQL